MRLTKKNYAIGILLSAGNEILLWELDHDKWKIICSKKPAAPITFAKFEPRSNTFATVGKVSFNDMARFRKHVTFLSVV